MHELNATSHARPGVAEAVSRGLSARAAVVALRLARLLESTCDRETAEDLVGFLRSWAEAAAEEAQPYAADAEPVHRLASRLSLTGPELDLLLLAGLPEEHEGLARIFRTMHPRGDSHPSVGLAALLLGEGPHREATAGPAVDRVALRALLHEGVAVRSGALAVTGEGTFHDRSLRLADQLWEALHGCAAWPGALTEVEAGPPVAGLESWLARPAARRAVAALRSTAPRTVIVTAHDETVALSRCAALARAAGLRPVAGRTRPEYPSGLGLLGLHAAARGGVPVLVAPRPEEGAGPTLLDLRRVVGPILVCAEPGAVRPGPERAVLTVPVGPIDTEDRRAAWRAALPDAAGRAPELAARHPLDPALTAQVALDVHSSAELAPDGEPTDVSAAIRTRAGAVLPPGVDLLSPSAPWGRLVLAEESDRQLRDAVSRLAYQSLVLDDWRLRESARADRGVRLLFSGAPGTGKSLAAEVLATAAGTDLLVVDVSRVVSKWIGETEKNLSAAFDAAERMQAVLFLDEADALFGTRTEISEANDRFANLETAYLLQRLDRFDGLAVLATNLRQNIDAAFVRRMDFVVTFDLPGEPDRHRLWRLHLPAAVRDEDVDLAALAHRYPVPGGWIRNAAIAAAFRAAEAGGRVGQRQLIDAMRREYAKANRPFPAESAAPPGAVADERALRALGAATTGSTREERS
ncbi:ATP-binding protein [Streptomyces sp. NRRL WC-3742]|uniref:ATP-binding protein n=1 Tax=Streptomyces sp. NRRL WC-3742 TaxID=1463934 RepID=UPI0004C77BE4|nr:ATP-binding protein [Streptomyces sp. NRRL WC-3742]